MTHDETLPLLDAVPPRDSIHAALLEDKTPEILFHEDALAATDSENEEDDVVSTDGSVVFDDDARLAACRSTGRVGAKLTWGNEPVAADLKLRRVGVDLTDGVLHKVQGYYLADEHAEDAQQLFELQPDELIVKVHLFRVRREIHAIQFVTNRRTSERFGATRHGELCKAVEAPDGAFIAGFFGDVARDAPDIDLGVRFGDRPAGEEIAHTEVEEIDQVK
ncbi:unnamed protein product [Phytophthora lilii]|uniref:Unnamed protein product n=1 Tax=Phytophthora lilii TaxID=2077276 RepID=A0A9W6TH06_9STRA|nr:unnamed protein product [Phytophthora lilii]